MKQGARWLVVSCLLAAACNDPAPTPADEVAAELRALRLQLAEVAAPKGNAPSAPASFQPAEVLAPLREVLDGLVKNQAELAARQVALTQELQRWSQLLVESVASARRDEAQSMAQKLAQFEQTLHQQDARHREVETLLQGALERTADRLDDFLRRLQGDGGKSGAPVPAATPPAATNPGASSPPQNHGQGGDERPLAARTGRTTMRWWWLGLTTVACLVVGLFLARAWRRPGAVGGLPPVPDGTAVDSPAREQTAGELWAAAALLGEAVDRLRQSQATAATPTELRTGSVEAQPPAPATAIADGTQASSAADTAPDDEPALASAHDTIDLAEFFVLEEDGELSPSTSPVDPGPRPTAAPAPSPRAHPEIVTWALPGNASSAQGLAFLNAQPGVLRKPAPVVRLVDGRARLEFAVLPDLARGDRSRLLLGLRAAATGPAVR